MKCPNCHTEIDHLREVCEGAMIRKLRMSSDGKLEIEELGFSPSYNDDELYVCPICGEVIATTIDDAIIALRGE